MPKYATPEGVVFEYTEDYANAINTDGRLTRVPDDTPVSPRECCGGTGWIVNGEVVHLGDGAPQDKYVPRHRKDD
jgi:hypothetical protein